MTGSGTPEEAGNAIDIRPDDARPAGGRSVGPAPVVVAGGGIVGASAALALQAAGVEVVLVDPAEGIHPAAEGHTGPASLGNAGHIATEQTRPLLEPATLRALPDRLFHRGGALDLPARHVTTWLPWSMRALWALRGWRGAEEALAGLLAEALPAWRRIAAVTGETTEMATGHLELWDSDAEANASAARWRRNGTGVARVASPGAADWYRLGAAWPSHPAFGLRFAGTGQVTSPARALQAIENAFRRRGGRTVRGRLVAVEGSAGADGGLVARISGETDRLAARAVLLAAGLGTAPLLRDLGLAMPLVAERGYHVEWSHAAAWHLPPIVLPSRSMIVTRFGNRLRASSFVEFAPADAPPDVRKWDRLEGHVRALALPVASPFVRWFGARPTLPDYLPALGPVPGHAGVFVACGHQHLGLTLGPRTGELLRDAILAFLDGRDDALAIPARCRPGRFGAVRGKRPRTPATAPAAPAAP